MKQLAELKDTGILAIKKNKYKTDTFKTSDFLSTPKDVLNYLLDENRLYWSSNLIDLRMLSQFENESVSAYKRWDNKSYFLMMYMEHLQWTPNNIILAILLDDTRDFFEYFPTSRYINSILKRNTSANTIFNKCILSTWKHLIIKHHNTYSYITQYFINLENKIIIDYLKEL